MLAVALALSTTTSGLAALRAGGSPRVLREPSRSRAAVDAVAMSTRGVVITGGAGGVGYAYADSFMARGHWVVICDVKDPAPAVRALRAKHGGGVGRVYGTVCDVSDAESVEALAGFAKESIGTVHYWINNAGINGGRRPFTSLSTGTLEAVVKVNLIGVLLCTKVALELMQAQQGVTSHIFNTVGSGVKGGGTPGYAAYGATKRGLPQMTDSLVAELSKGVPGFDVAPPIGERAATCYMRSCARAVMRTRCHARAVMRALRCKGGQPRATALQRVRAAAGARHLTCVRQKLAAGDLTGPRAHASGMDT